MAKPKVAYKIGSEAHTGVLWDHDGDTFGTSVRLLVGYDSAAGESSGTTTPTTALEISPAPVRVRATVGAPYRLELSAPGGTAPYTFSLYGLPPRASA
ncbi:hypothetical protein [Capillimicrobium parvum]|uniref:Uncharacterized protein n=1 Tax=Capillimicrobium parvum TaxID=2884022 RepID=A0A9E6XTC6_9ACTN|nr:hypothetical protein [Capillimicrobium parvum]UGS34233.1 hypothetical protein DSM104329_00606 [Capillimicrobium parvum]